MFEEMEIENVQIFESFSNDHDSLDVSTDSGQSSVTMDTIDAEEEEDGRCRCEARINLDLKIVKQRLHISNAERDQQMRKVNFLSKELFILEEEVLTKETELELLQEQVEKERLAKEEAVDLLQDMESYSNTEMATLRSRIDLLETQTNAMQTNDEPQSRDSETQCNTLDHIIREHERRQEEDTYDYKLTIHKLSSQIEDLLLEKETLRDEVDFVRNEGAFLVESKQDEIQSLQQLIEESIVKEEMGLKDDGCIEARPQPRLSTLITDLDAVMMYSQSDGNEVMTHAGETSPTLYDTSAYENASEESDSYDDEYREYFGSNTKPMMETNLDDVMKIDTSRDSHLIENKETNSTAITGGDIVANHCAVTKYLISIAKYGRYLKESLISSISNFSYESKACGGERHFYGSLLEMINNRFVVFHGVAFAGHLFIALLLDLPFKAVPLCCVSIILNAFLNRKLDSIAMKRTTKRRIETTPIKRQKRVESYEIDDMSELDDLSILADKEHEVVMQQQRAIELLQYRLEKETNLKLKYKRMAAKLQHHRHGKNGFTRDRHQDFEFQKLSSIAECEEGIINCVSTQTECELKHHQGRINETPLQNQFIWVLLLWICLTLLLHYKEAISSLAPGSLAMNMFASFVVITRQLNTTERDKETDVICNSNLSICLSVAMIILPVFSCFPVGLQMVIVTQVTLVIFYNTTLRVVMRNRNDLKEKEAVIMLMKERLALEIQSRINVKQDVKLVVEEPIVLDCLEPVLCEMDWVPNHDDEYTNAGVGIENEIVECNELISCNGSNDELTHTALEAPLVINSSSLQPNHCHTTENHSDSLRKAKSMIDLRLTKWDSEQSLNHYDNNEVLTTVGTVANSDRVNKKGEDYIFMTLCWLIEQLDGFILQMKRLLQDEDSRIRETHHSNYETNNNDHELLDINDVKDWMTQFERKKEEHVMGVWKMMSEIEVVYSQILSKSAELLTLSDNSACQDDDGGLKERPVSPALIHDIENQSLLTDRSTASHQSGISSDTNADLLPPGIVYNLATDFGASQWDEMRLGDAVSFSRSSCGFGDDFNLLSRKPEICSTQDLEHSWIRLDFGIDRLVLARGYGLRHGWPSRGNALRRWILEASNDGCTWHVLRKHVLDSSLNDRFALMKWPLSDVFKPYRFFQVRMTGLNSSHSNELYVNAMEIYGKIVEK